MKRHAWRSGDIIQIALPAGYRYVQLVGKYAHLAGKGPRRFDLLRVLNVVTKEPETDLTTLGESSSAYWFLSFAGLLVEDTRFVFIGNAACSAESPTMRRRFLGDGSLSGPAQTDLCPIQSATRGCAAPTRGNSTFTRLIGWQRTGPPKMIGKTSLRRFDAIRNALALKI